MEPLPQQCGQFLFVECFRGRIARTELVFLESDMTAAQRLELTC